MLILGRGFISKNNIEEHIFFNQTRKTAILTGQTPLEKEDF